MKKYGTSLYYDSYVRYKENQTTIYEYAQYSKVKIQQSRNYIHGENVPAAATVLISCGLLQQHAAPCTVS